MQPQHPDYDGKPGCCLQIVEDEGVKLRYSLPAVEEEAEEHLQYPDYDGKPRCCIQIVEDEGAKLRYSLPVDVDR